MDQYLFNDLQTVHGVAPSPESTSDKMEKGRFLFIFLTLPLLSVWLPKVGASRTTSSPTLEEAIASYRDGPRYLNSWAVEVRSGRNVADDLARKHGFVNRGQVSIWYRYVHMQSLHRATTERRESDK